MDQKQLLEHAFKAGRISTNTSFEEWYATFYTDNLDPDKKLFEEAKSIVIESQQCCTSFLQRKLKIGYNRAKELCIELYDKGVVGPLPENEVYREVLLKP